MAVHNSKTEGGSSKSSTPTKLTARQLRAMDLILSGMPLQEIAERLEVNRQTVSWWRNKHPEFKAKLAELMAEAEAELRYSIPLNDGFMLSNLRKLAAEGNGETRLKAIQFYFEKFGRQSEEVGSAPSLNETDALLLRVMERRRESARATSHATTSEGNA